MKTRYAILTLFLLVFGTLPCGAAEVTINVFGEAWIKGEQARVGELGLVTASAGAAPLVESIKDVSVIRVPDAGRPVVINREYISVRLKQSGIDTTGVEVIAPPQIRIHREARAAAAGDIRQEVEQYVKSNLGAGAEKAKISITGIEDDLMLPPGRTTFEVGADAPPKYWGYTRVPVVIKVDDVVKKKVWARVSVTYLDDVVVLKGAVRRGEIITEDMVGVEQRDTLRLQNAVVKDMADVVGRTATRNIKAGDVVMRNAVELPVVVKRGNRVMVIAENNGFRVSIRAEAMENGARGDVIKMKNIDSRKIISAEVVDGSTAKATF